MSIDTYYYDKQIKKHLLQFMTVFSGLQVKIGKRDDSDEKLISVPIHYGSKDRVTAAILQENTQNKLLRLPVMSTHMSNLALAPQLRKGVGVSRTNAFVPLGGVYPDDTKTIHQLMPIPYMMNIDLAIMTSNMDQMDQILEQILLIFNPTLQIQTSDAPFDWTRISTIELTGIGDEENYPSGTDRRMSIYTLNFDLPIYLSGPANIKSEFIKSVLLRLHAVDTSVDFTKPIQPQLNDNDLLCEIVLDDGSVSL